MGWKNSSQAGHLHKMSINMQEYKPRPLLVGGFNPIEKIFVKMGIFPR